MAIDPERWTVKTREVFAAATQQAAAANHAEVVPAHLLAAVLAQPEGIAGPLLARVGVELPEVARRTQDELSRLARAVGGSEPTLSRGARDLLESADGLRGDMGDDFVSVEHLLLAMADRIGASPRSAPDRPPRDQGEPPGDVRHPGADLPGARALWPRSHPAGPPGEARPGHRARRGDPPRHSGALPPDEEQPGAHRGARRRQDGDRRGPGQPDHRRRRARRPQGPPGDRARPRFDGGRGEVPGRVRGADEGRAEGDHRRRGSGGHLHRRAAHPRRCRWRPRGRWTPATWSSPCWPGASSG